MRARGVLVTRPALEAEETAARLRALGWHPVLAPMIRIEARPVRVPPGRRPQAVLVTSGNALATLPAELHGTAMLAVGDATAARARALGFWRVGSAGGDAAALLQLATLSCDPQGAALLLAVGEGQGMPLLGALQGRGFRVVRRVAYAARPVGALGEAARAALRQESAGAALFFSTATAFAFAHAVRRAGLAGSLAGVAAVAISGAAAEALSPLPWRDIRVASRPTQDELLACL